jgi:hypothetical protein
MSIHSSPHTEIALFPVEDVGYHLTKAIPLHLCTGLRSLHWNIPSFVLKTVWHSRWQLREVNDRLLVQINGVFRDTQRNTGETIRK